MELLKFMDVLIKSEEVPHFYQRAQATKVMRVPIALGQKSTGIFAIRWKTQVP